MGCCGDDDDDAEADAAAPLCCADAVTNDPPRCTRSVSRLVRAIDPMYMVTAWLGKLVRSSLYCLSVVLMKKSIAREISTRRLVAPGV